MDLCNLPASLTERFDVIEPLGDSRCGKQVLLAADRQGGPDVVIVRIPCWDPLRFEHEIGYLQRLDSAYLPKIFELCIAPSDRGHDACAVVEYCEGPTLAQVVHRGALAVSDAAPILVELARALAMLHRALVEYRDLRLHNAMLASSEAGPRLVLLDLGLSTPMDRIDTEAAEPWRQAHRMLPYMAREVIRGEHRDPRSDVYALGVCCFRILTGEFPIPSRARESDLEYLIRAQGATIDLGSLPVELPPAARSCVERMLDHRRDHRPFTLEVVAAFERAFGAPALPAVPPVARPLPARR